MASAQTLTRGAVIGSLKNVKPLRPHPNLYEINAWPWLDRLSTQRGQKVTLETVPDSEWDRLQQQGFDLVYLMGIWSRSMTGRTISRSLPLLFPGYTAALPEWTMQHVVGSPFSVRAYEPDGHIGTWAELAQLREKLNNRGMKLILDFVGNHTGLDYEWVQGNPDFYIQGTLEDYKRAPQQYYLSETTTDVRFIAYGRDPNFSPWLDTAQLNYFNPRQRQAMMGELCTISQFCDGVRCDMAMLLLNNIFGKTWANQLQTWPQPREEFWREAVASLPGFIWIAEAYGDTEWRLQQLGFHYTYDKSFYDRLQQNNIAALKLHLKDASIEFQSHSARFLENHDEARSAEAFGAARLPAIAVLMATVPGMHFYHEGQLEGRKIKIPVQLARAQQEAPDEKTRAIYEKILSIANVAAFHEGTWTWLEAQPTGDGTHENLIAYLWRHQSGDRLIVVNLAPANSTGKIFLPPEALPARQLNLADELNGQNYVRDRADLERNGLFIMLGANQAHMFRIED